MEVADEEANRFEHHWKGGLLEIFSEIKDPRSRKPDYPLTALLTGLVVAFLKGVRHMNQVPVYLSKLHHKQRKKLGFPDRIADESSFRRVLCALDPRALEDALAPWFASEGLEFRSIGFDGKRQNGAHDSAQRPPEVLNVVEHGTGIVLGHVGIEQGRDEREALQRFISGMTIKNALITADALHTNVELMQKIIDSEADYFLYVKKNQPGAWQTIEGLHLDEWRGPAHAHTFEANKGREEVREVWATSRHCKGRSSKPIFPGAGQIGTIVRTITDLKSGKVTRERIHFVTSLQRVEASPEELLNYARGHWTVESKNHYVKDTTMGEDRCRCRRGSLPQILGIMRSVTLKILRSVQIVNCLSKGRDTIPEAMRTIERNGGACTLF
jgi:predicted transposase YbfD/YdcC